MNLIISFCSFHNFYASTAWKVKVRNQRKILGGCVVPYLSYQKNTNLIMGLLHSFLVGVFSST